TSAVLALAVWGGDESLLPEPLPAGHRRQASDNLVALGAVEDADAGSGDSAIADLTVTDTGRAIAAIPASVWPALGLLDGASLPWGPPGGGRVPTPGRWPVSGAAAGPHGAPGTGGGSPPWPPRTRRGPRPRTPPMPHPRLPSASSRPCPSRCRSRGCAAPRTPSTCWPRAPRPACRATPPCRAVPGWPSPR